MNLNLNTVFSTFPVQSFHGIFMILMYIFTCLVNDILLRGELNILSIPFLCIFMCCLIA